MSYPEHEKLQEVVETSQAIGDFLDWLSSVKQIRFAKWVKDKTESGTEFEVFVQQNMQITDWTAEYFGIDLKKLEQEKLAMLEELREAQCLADKQQETEK